MPHRSIAASSLSFDFGTKLLSLHSFLSTDAVRATDAAEGIDHCSANNSTTYAVQSITAPILFAGMGAFVFIQDDELSYELAHSRDKELICFEGAEHGFQPCRPCETTPGQYGKAPRNFFDHVLGWINARF